MLDSEFFVPFYGMNFLSSTRQTNRWGDVRTAVLPTFCHLTIAARSRISCSIKAANAARDCQKPVAMTLQVCPGATGDGAWGHHARRPSWQPLSPKLPRPAEVPARVVRHNRLQIRGEVGNYE